MPSWNRRASLTTQPALPKFGSVFEPVLNHPKFW